MGQPQCDGKVRLAKNIQSEISDLDALFLAAFWLKDRYQQKFGIIFSKVNNSGVFLFECDVGRIRPMRGQYYETPPTQKITKYLIKTKRLLFPIIYYFFGE